MEAGAQTLTVIDVGVAMIIFMDTHSHKCVPFWRPLMHACCVIVAGPLTHLLLRCPPGENCWVWDTGGRPWHQHAGACKHSSQEAAGPPLNLGGNGHSHSPCLHCCYPTLVRMWARRVCCGLTFTTCFSGVTQARLVKGSLSVCAEAGMHAHFLSPPFLLQMQILTVTFLTI